MQFHWADLIYVIPMLQRGLKANFLNDILHLGITGEKCVYSPTHQCAELVIIWMFCLRDKPY